MDNPIYYQCPYCDHTEDPKEAKDGYSVGIRGMHTHILATHYLEMLRVISRTKIAATHLIRRKD